ncbi:MAG: hypothetical protein M3Q83_02530 [Pseudomonadota bacterium]|nr:hypothetical protein [Pseudomonadota bacterium]
MSNFNAGAAIKAGLIAGLVFMMLEMLLVATIGGGSPWAPPRMIGAMALGEGVLPPPAPFDLTVFMVAMLIHFILAIVLGLLFAAIAEAVRLSRPAAAIVGLLFGLAVYVVNFYGMTAIFPWFAMARNGISIFAHLMFGLVLGYTYRALAPLVVVRHEDR